MVVAAVAAGAFAAASAGQLVQSASSDEPVSQLAHSDSEAAGVTHDGVGGSAPAATPAILSSETSTSADAEAAELAQSQEVTEERQKREKAEAKKKAEAAEAAEADDADSDSDESEASSGSVVSPAEGTFTSGYGARWGTSHNGIDIANSIGTPIKSVSDGTVLEAGPASGFGLWVRVQHDDGTVTVYGHVNSFSVAEGDKVKAGEEIAEMGNRGQSTGPHLHFEVWEGDGGAKIDPKAWLTQHGVSV